MALEDLLESSTGFPNSTKSLSRKSAYRRHNFRKQAHEPLLSEKLWEHLMQEHKCVSSGVLIPLLEFTS